jgi:hypothetical protein
MALHRESIAPGDHPMIHGARPLLVLYLYLCDATGKRLVRSDGPIELGRESQAQKLAFFVRFSQ